MRKKTETRKKFGRICALVVVGMFVVMTLPTSVVAPPGNTPWTGGGDIVIPGDALGTINPPEDPAGALVFVAGGDGAPYTGIQRMVIDHNTGFVGIALPGDIWVPPVPVNQLDVGGNMAVGEGFAGRFPAPPNGMIIEGWVGIGTPRPMEALDIEGNVHASGSLKSGNSIEIVGGGINRNTIYYEDDNHGLPTDWNLWFKGGSESSHGESYVLFQNGLFTHDMGVAITMNETRGHNKFWLSAYDEHYGNLIYTEDPLDGSGQGFGIAGGSHMDPFDRFVVNSDEMFLGYCKMPGDGTLDSGGDGAGNLYVRGNVGIGTTNPSAKLDVSGGSFGAAQRIISISGIHTDSLSGAQINYGIDAETIQHNPSSNSPGTFVGANFRAYTPTICSANIGTLGGVNAKARHAGSGTADAVYALKAGANSWGGTITNAYGVITQVWTPIADGNIANAYGVYIDDNTGNIGNSYGLYQAGSDDINYFAGNVGIGTVSPDRVLHIKDTSNPPLKYECTTATGKSGQDLYIPIDVNGTIYYIKLYS